MRQEKHRLPLTSLRAFEAVGRHLHMRRAAEEMCVSHSAISQQVRKLESFLDVLLLERTNRGLKLTPPGSRLLREVTVALDMLVNATEHVAPDSSTAELRIACTAGLAAHWMIPNLESFLRGYPSYTAHISTVPALPKDIPRDVDVAVTYGKPQVSDSRVSQLPESPLLPVCSPQLNQRIRGKRKTPRAIASQMLIHSDEGREWRQWFSLAGSRGLTSERNLYFNAGYHVILDCVRRGMGIGLIARRFIERDIDEGQLIVLSELPMFEPEHYYLVRPRGQHLNPAAKAFEQWIHKEWARW